MSDSIAELPPEQRLRQAMRIRARGAMKVAAARIYKIETDKYENEYEDKIEEAPELDLAS